jgi:hypothetical protein
LVRENKKLINSLLSIWARGRKKPKYTVNRRNISKRGGEGGEGKGGLQGGEMTQTMYAHVNK